MGTFMTVHDGPMVIRFYIYKIVGPGWAIAPY